MSKSGSVVIDQLIICSSYQEAISVSKTFDKFSFKVFFLGDRQTVRARRFIRKIESSKEYSHKVVVRYKLDYESGFHEYGFIDAKTIKRVPKIIDELRAAPKDRRWEIAFQYENMDDTDLYDVYYYESFDWFFKEKLRPLLNTINLACQVAFARQLDTSFFEIVYEECGSWYSRTYIAEKGSECVPHLECGELTDIDPTFLPISSVWEWSQKHYYNKKDIWTSEARAWVSLSNGLNHVGYESLLYSIIGLEYVYAKNERKVKQQLRESIPIVLPEVTSEEIETLYKIRSDFVHGSLAFPLFGEDNLIQEYSNVKLAAGILLKTVRLLVENDANRIIVTNGKVQYIKDDTYISRKQRSLTPCER